MIHSDEKSSHIADKLITYLRSELNDATLAYDSPLTQLKGGLETATYQFQLKGVEKELNKRMVLRLYPEHRPPEDAVWESRVQNVLADTGYPVARAFLVCTDKSILGGVFFLMEFLPGIPIWAHPIETVAEMLGNTHAALHQIDPQPVIKSLDSQGFGENRRGFRKDFYDALANAVEKNEFPWVGDIQAWLRENRPPEPARLAICHGDFHPGNILITDGKVRGVVDWHLSIADSALDVANTIKLITIHYKHFFERVSGRDAESIDLETLSQLYLDTYQKQFPLDPAKLDYYGVLQCLVDFHDGNLGNRHLREPGFRTDLFEFIDKVTGIRITMPDFC